MDEGPRTFRDHFLSIFQSAAADVARQNAAQRAPRGTMGIAGAPAAAPAKAPEVAAAENVAAHFAADAKARAGGHAAPLAMTATDTATVCANLAMRLMWAKLKHDTATANQIENEQLPDSGCDPKWASTVTEYLKYFGPNGDWHPIPYVAPTATGPKIIPIKAGARIGLIGDWGTGAVPAQRVLRELKAQNPDVVIHLGDIYYSATETECRINFEDIVDAALERARTGIPVYTLAGNHDMYSGGGGYYALLGRLNKAPMTQTASFFCLRADDNSWQLLALDTGQHDHNPISVAHALTYVEPAELDWHEARIREFPGKTILLSHHQLFSAFAQIGVAGADGRFAAHNPALKKALDQLAGTGKEIAAWFWGHEHNLCIYQPYLGLERGRCLGHSAIPVFQQDYPYKVMSQINDPPAIVEAAKLQMANGIYSHGFAMLQLGADKVTVDYFEDRSGTATKTYSETIE